jgi:hypothetical protein
MSFRGASAKEGRDAVRAPQTHHWVGATAKCEDPGARDEFHLAATAQNLRKLATLIPMRKPLAAT